MVNKYKEKVREEFYKNFLKRTFNEVRKEGESIVFLRDDYVYILGTRNSSESSVHLVSCAGFLHDLANKPITFAGKVSTITSVEIDEFDTEVQRNFTFVNFATADAFVALQFAGYTAQGESLNLELYSMYRTEYEYIKENNIQYWGY